MATETENSDERIATCSQCEGPNDQPNDSNVCSACAAKNVKLELQNKEAEARQAELVKEADAAVELVNDAAFAGERALHLLRDTEWYAFSANHAAFIWDAVAKALDALPPTATQLDVARAQARAIADAEAEIAKRCQEGIVPAAQLARTAVDDYHAKRAAANEAIEKASALERGRRSATSWAMSGIAGMAGAWFMAKYTGKGAK